MTDKPERIWAWHNHEVPDEGGWQVEERYNGEVQYIRADLADAKDQRIKDLEETVESLRAEVDETYHLMYSINE